MGSEMCIRDSFDAEQEFKEFAAEDTEETQSKLNYLQNKKGGK